MGMGRGAEGVQKKPFAEIWGSIGHVIKTTKCDHNVCTRGCVWVPSEVLYCFPKEHQSHEGRSSIDLVFGLMFPESTPPFYFLPGCPVMMGMVMVYG